MLLNHTQIHIYHIFFKHSFNIYIVFILHILITKYIFLFIILKKYFLNVKYFLNLFFHFLHDSYIKIYFLYISILRMNELMNFI